MRLLVVDDSPANIELMERLLVGAGYTRVLCTRDPTCVGDICHSWQPDAVLLDLQMPRLDGFGVMAAISSLMEAPESLPVIVLTADATTDSRHRALTMGARDFVTKPIDGRELLLRTRNILQTRCLQKHLRDQNLLLEDAVRRRTEDLDRERIESLGMLAAVGEFHDGDTHEHTQRVGLSAACLASAMDMTDSFVADIRAAAPLHDIGKIGVTRQILQKPGALDDAERRMMMRHSAIGERILSGASSPVLRLAAQIARSHHERWDGTGYPDGLVRDQAPIAARITAVADVFDALTHRRPYKPAWEVARAVRLIGDEAGRQFDPTVAAALLELDCDRVASGSLLV